VIELTAMDKIIKVMISERDSDLNHRGQLNLKLVETFKLRERLDYLKRTYFGWKGRILSPKKQSFLLKKNDYFVFWPITLLAKGWYLILAAVDGKGIYVTIEGKWHASSPFPLPFSYSPEEILESRLFPEEMPTKKRPGEILTKEFLKINPNNGIVIAEKDLSDDSKVTSCQNELDKIISKKFFETFLKDYLNK